MPPNLGGFFMVRSYYPSECHADYFDFERIEALKPAIEACGISTLSQSPMLGFHKQMDNRIKLLEEILSFRMQGVEFDNGDMYVDGHKAASDVRDEFVSVTENLMDELAQCYNVLPQLDINNTIDHRPEGDEKWFLENEKDRKSGSAGMPRPNSYAVLCLKKKRSSSVSGGVGQGRVSARVARISSMIRTTRTISPPGVGRDVTLSTTFPSPAGVLVESRPSQLTRSESPMGPA